LNFPAEKHNIYDLKKFKRAKIAMLENPNLAEPAAKDAPVGSSRYAPGGNQTGVNKLQTPNYKQILNYNVCLPADRNDQNQSFGILDFFIGIYLLFGICYLMFNRQKDYVGLVRHHEKLY
jgi:hypothetical protein